METHNETRANLVKALQALQKTRQKLQALEAAQHEPIAVIGMACRFPGANSPEAFWTLLRHGVDRVTKVPTDRWNMPDYYDPVPGTPGKSYVQEGAFLTKIDEFDPQFFGIAPREATSMDPQHRLLLETSWEALERAGQAPAALKNSKTGVFVGVTPSEYIMLHDEAQRTAPYVSTGNSVIFAAGRLSYVLGLQGPNLVVDTACSASLIGVHLACESLRSGSSDLALAGGVHLMLSPHGHIAMAQMQALAPDGRSRSFDAAANGFGRGEGCGMVVLKRLSDALTDHDPILALIRGSAINHDGPSSGLTVPSATAQAALIRSALENGQVEAHEVQYVEAHGTGTALGDPIEVRALATVFGERSTPLLVGSVKTNIGHLEEAAGIASLMKVILAMQQHELPPNLHLHNPNPHIDWATTRIRIPTTCTPWPAGKKVAGVSSFGLGGSNAHVIVEEAPVRSEPPITAERPCHLLTLSAKSPQALQEMAQRYHEFLHQQPEMPLGDLCYTTHTGRNHFAQRLSITTASLAQLQADLAAYGKGELNPGVTQGNAPEQQAPPKVAFLFTGQGAQYVGMGRELYATQPTFRAVIDRCDALLQERLGRSLLALLYPASTATANDLLTSHVGGQVATYALACALADLWRSWGVQPSVVLGHSLGDFAAAYTAGVCSLEVGLHLVIARGQLMETVGGRMVAILASAAEVAPFLAPLADVALAVINGPKSVVIAGGEASVAQVTAQVQQAGYQTRTLAIPVAAHSPLLDPVLDAFAAVVRQAPLTAPTIPVVSSMTGQLVTQELTDPVYWRQHLRHTVCFAAAVQTLNAQGVDSFLEIGPKPTLLSLVEQNRAAEPPARATHYLPSLREHQSDWQQLLASLGALYVQGVPIDWQGFDQDYQRRKVVLPTYPFQRQRYWLDAPKPQRLARAALRPLIDRMIQLPLHKQTLFETEFSGEALPFLNDHRVYDRLVSPGACQLVMVLHAAALTFGQDQALRLTDVILPQPLVISEAGMRLVQALVTPLTANGHAPEREFKLISFDPETGADEPATHATGQLGVHPIPPSAVIDLAALQARCSQAVDIAAFYTGAAAQQLQLGPSFRWLTALWQGVDPATPEAFAKLSLPVGVGVAAGHLIHPGLLDACFQVAGSTEFSHAVPGSTTGDATLLPFALAALHLHQSTHGDTWWCHARLVGPLKWDILLLDIQGTPVATLERFEMRPAVAAALHGGEDWQDWLYRVVWEQQPFWNLPPIYLPLPPAVTPTLQATLALLGNEQAREAERRFQLALEDQSLTYVLAAFAKVGFSFQPGVRWRSEQIAQQMGVLPQYRRLLERLLGMLTEVGILQRVEGAWLVVQTPQTYLQSPSLPNHQQDATERVETILLARCGAKLSEVLRGVQEPLELLFPGGDVGAATQLYTESPGAGLMNKLVQKVVQTAIQHLPPARGIRIVEVGAGTGGTTAGLLPLLPVAQTAYFFTDIGPRFLSKAQERFAAYNFIRYQPLDIEQSPLSQGFAQQQADIVLAVNVLHATSNISATLTHVRQLLQPNGWLVLVEATNRSRWVDLTFGLTDGWWRFADDRQSHPLLAADQWQTRLGQNGFQAVETVEQDGQTLILAQAAVRALEAPVHQPPAEFGEKPVAAPRGHPMPPQRTKWLLFADNGGMALTLAAQCQQQGESPILVYASDRYQQIDDQTFRIRPDTLADYQALLVAVQGLQGVVHLWSLDAPNVQNAADIEQITQRGCGTALLLVQALLANQITFPPGAGGLWLVTQEAQRVGELDKATGMAQAGLWGMGKVIALEHPELQCRCIDLEGASRSERQALQLWAELNQRNGGAPTSGGQEAQIALRRDARYVARLWRSADRSASEEELAVPATPCQLAITERGTLDNLALKPVARRAPASGEVELQVQASGLNFRDVLNSLGLYPGDPGPLGAECTGVIVAVGDGVANFAIGDAVLALCAASFSQYVTVNAHQVVHKPATLSHPAAATIPIAFLTAHYGLHHLAQIKAGDRVLIHAATGGVGMAAVQLAQLAGAEVFGTASPGKWDALSELGVTHIYNSRTLDFAKAVMADTEGQGVNLILNSLTGEGFIEANLGLLATNGHLVELSKRGIWTAEAVATVRPDVGYTPFDLGAVIREQPALLNAMFTKLMPLFTANKLKPLPYCTFPLQAARRAFRIMQQAKHVGKLVLIPPAPQVNKIQADATYLITGGLGGLGLAVAEWLAGQGARHLLLIGRSHPKPAAQEQVAALTAKGVTVTIAQADVTNLEQVRTVLQQVNARYPLRGVIHAVGVLDDDALMQQSWTRFSRVLAPKVTGAWHLHTLTQELPLDFFVLFSSATSLFGNHGQANHAAANACLDAFAAYRHAQGLPCLSINWGAWSEIGAAADLVRAQKQQMAEQGMGVIDPQQGLAAFAHLLQQAHPQVGVTPMVWTKFLKGATAPNAFYAAFITAEPSSGVSVPPKAPALRQQLLAVEGEERQRLLMQHLRGAVAKVLGIRSPEQIDPQQGLLTMGLDSLMAIELRNHLARTLEQPLPATLIFDYPTLEALSTYLLAAITPTEDEISLLKSDAQTILEERTPVTDLAQAPPLSASEPPITDNDVAQKLQRLEALLGE